jgi:CRP/FNR family cyclic AMP-dependent transcriptional regulator
MAEEYFQKQMYNAGDVIFHEGAKANHMYLIESGQVEIFKTIDGAKKVLVTLGKGSIFGEMALIDQSPRAASVAAVSPTVCVKIPQAKVNEALGNSPPFIRGLLKILVTNLRK